MSLPALALSAGLVEAGVQAQKEICHGIVSVYAAEIVRAMRVAVKILALDHKDHQHAGLEHVRAFDMGEVVGQSALPVARRNGQRISPQTLPASADADVRNQGILVRERPQERDI